MEPTVQPVSAAPAMATPAVAAGADAMPATPTPVVPVLASRDFLLAEYAALRGEILKRTEIQHQLVSIALVAIGTFLSLSETVPRFVLLLYPLLATFLAAAWAQNNFRILQLGKYIKDEIEAKLIDNGGWEHFLGLLRAPSRYGSLSYLMSRGIIVGTQMLAVLAFLFQKSLSDEEFWLFFVDVLVIALTWRLLMPEPLVTKSGPVFTLD